MANSNQSQQEELTRIRSLADRDDNEVAADWDSCDDDALAKAIEQYRSAVQFLSSRLQCLTAQGSSHANRSVEISVDQLDPSQWQVPPHCIPILADVRSYDWRQLYRACQFDVIVMDPPWQLATANPTRGVALSYGQLTNKDIVNIPIDKLQSDGLLFLWVINSSFDFAMTLLETWGYRIVDEVVWVKLTVNRRLAKSNGYYLQHAKEVCLVGIKGRGPQKMTSNAIADVILSERRGQSQKPDEIYDLIEALVPDGKYLEIFARKNNLRNFWVSLGNEVLGYTQCLKHSLTDTSGD